MSASISELMSSVVQSSSSRPILPHLVDSVVVSLLLAAMAAMYYQYRAQGVEARFERMANEILARASQNVRAEIDTITGDVLLVASHPDRSPQAVKERLRTLLQVRPAYLKALHIDNQGQLLVQATRPGAEESVSLPASYQVRALSLGPGQLHASEPQRESGTHALIYFATPLFDDRLQRHGAMIVAYEAAALTRSLKTGVARARFELLDSSGRSLGAPPASGTAPASSHHWSQDIRLSPSNADSPYRVALRLSFAEDMVNDAKRAELSSAAALWLLLMIPTGGLAYVARRARDSERRHNLMLAENQERLLEAERLARLGYWRWEARGDTLTLSPQAAAMLGKQPGQQSMKMSDATALHVLDTERSFLERIEQVMTSGETVSADIRVAALRGDRWLHSLMRPVRDTEGNTIGVFGTLQDITPRKWAEQELRMLKSDYAALLDHIPAGVTYMDLEGRCVMVNQAILDRTGLTREQFEGHLYQEIFQPEEASQRLAANFEVIRSEQPKLGSIEQIVGLGGKRTRWLRIDAIPRRDGNGKVIGVVVFVVDISELKAIEQQLRSLTAEREMILNRIPAFVLHKDIDGYVVHANRMTSVYARKPLDQIIGSHGTDVFPNSDAERISKIDEEVIRTGEPALGVIEPVLLEDGSTRWYQIDVFPDIDETGRVNGLVIFGLDISERKRAEEQIAYLAMHDPLTDLCNRRLLTDRLTQTLAHCRRRERCCGLLFVDLDHFKVVNDEHGHEIGDLLLVQVAQRLRSCLRSEDTVARTGGDEFVILLTETATAEDACTIAEQIRAMLSLPFEIRGVVLKIGCSIGVASYPEHGCSEHELMSAADTAMYAAKESGRNAVRVAAPAILRLSEHDAA